MQEVYHPAEELFASKEGLCSTDKTEIVYL